MTNADRLILYETALFLLPYVPVWARPWLIGIALGREPIRLEYRDGKWRLPEQKP